MRVVYVVGKSSYGGSWTLMKAYSHLLVGAGHDLLLVVIDSTGAKSREEVLSVAPDFREVELLRVGSLTHDGIRAVRKLKAALCRWDPDLVHTFLRPADVVGGIAARLAGVPCTRSIVGTPRLHSAPGFRRADWRGEILSRLVTRITPGAAAVSETAMTHAVRQGLGRSGKVDVVYPGVGTSSGGTSAGQSPRYARTAAKRILSVARVIASKGVFDEILCCHELVTRGQDIEWLHAGIGASEAMEAGEHLIRDLGLEGRFVFLGFVSDVRSLLATTDLLVSMSYAEGLVGYSILEAMQHDVPVVGPDIDELTELLEAGVHLMTAQPGSISGYADAIQAVLSGSVNAVSMVREARQRVEAVLSDEGVLAMLLNHYARVMCD